jgi:3-hydroxyisobutyrate dehydrogenase
MIGFIGLGLMGEPIARRIVLAGHPVLVWNRTPGKERRLVDLGAHVCDDVDTLFERSAIVVLMLADEVATDEVLARSAGHLGRRVHDRTLVQMGTTSPTYSARLAADVARAGGCYVEAPVSGSRLPAERGDLVALVAGDTSAVDRVVPVLGTACRQVVRFGDVPNASVAKLAVNLFLVTMVTGLAESVLFAQKWGLDAAAFAQALNGGPMASDVSRTKLAKLLAGDHSAQAAAVDVLKNCRLICDAAHAAGLALPLVTATRDLFTATVDLGHGGSDMSAVLHALTSGEAAT